MSRQETFSDERGCLEGSPNRRRPSSADGPWVGSCSNAAINSPLHSYTAAAACKSAPSALGARCPDGRTRRYVRSSEPRLKWNDDLHQCFVQAIEHLAGCDRGNVEQITELRKVGESVFAMAQPNAGAARANREVPQEDGAAVADGALQLVNGAVLPQIDGARVRAAGQVAAPVAGPLVAPVAVALFPQGLVPARFGVDAILLGPLPRKSNGSCKILPKIPEATWP